MSTPLCKDGVPVILCSAAGGAETMICVSNAPIRCWQRMKRVRARSVGKTQGTGRVLSQDLLR